MLLINFKNNLMRISLLILLTMLFSFSAADAQFQTPAASPMSKVSQEVGLTDVTIEYSRPSMKGRAIFGDLVPFDKMWRTGANKNTMITFSDDVKIGASDVKAGTYAIFTKPGKETWEIYLYSDTNNWGTPEKWDDANVAAKVMAKPTKLPVTIETFLINVGSISNNGATIQMIWENTLVAFDLSVPTKATVEKSIEKLLAGPSARDYYSMAGFYLDEKENLETALEFINKSISMDYERFWSVRRKALIEAELGKYKDAIKTAQKSIELAKEAGNDDYVNSNMKSIAKWSKM